jgi:dienelactone hydrolase
VYVQVRAAAQVAQQKISEIETELEREIAIQEQLNSSLYSGPPHLLFPIASIPAPALPELGTPFRTTSSGVDLHFVEFANVPGNGTGPGQQMSLRVYRPAGPRAPGSTPCVLVAPAGTNLLVGNAMDADDYHDETLPYAEAGMVVIFYSLDGPVDMETASDSEVQAGYLQFRAACAGVVNARNAFEFAIARIPEVDPAKVFTAGHSSAGTVSLLMAEHDPRVAGCIAYAPCSDVAAFHGSTIYDPSLSALLPRLGDFVVQGSPMTHASNLRCPTFLFQAADDSVVDANDTRAFKTLLEARGTPVTYEEVPTGEHYDSMIENGIPAAIRWIQSR